MVSPARIYVSVPDESHLTSEQVQMKNAILEAVVNHGFAPQIFYESGRSAGQAFTVEHADRLMAECHGVLILALTKWYRAKLLSKGTADLASEFSHLEGGLAIAHDLPLLILTEERVKPGGINFRGGGKMVHVWPRKEGIQWIQSPAFKRYIDEWAKKVRDQRKVFLGYCSAAKDTAEALISYMEGIPDVSVVNYAIHFQPGSTILEEIENASKECSVGVFLFTKDDELVGTESHTVPRDNVIWEAGYFIRAKGKRRVLIIREEGAKMPADLGGVIYLSLQDRANIGPLEDQIQRFLDTTL
jgi:hypothetical protein